MRVVERQQKRSAWKDALHDVKMYFWYCFSNLFPHKQIVTFFTPPIGGCEEVLEIRTVWLGVTLNQRQYELAHSKRREEFLKMMYKSKKISYEEYQKFMPQQGGHEKCEK